MLLAMASLAQPAPPAMVCLLRDRLLPHVATYKVLRPCSERCGAVLHRHSQAVASTAAAKLSTAACPRPDLAHALQVWELCTSLWALALLDCVTPEAWNQMQAALLQTLARQTGKPATTAEHFLERAPCLPARCT